MKTLKKTLCLVLAVVMVVGVLVLPAAAADDDTFKDDAQISEEYSQAVDLLNVLKVLQGANGYFSPKGHLTRAEGATIIARVMVGPDLAKDLPASATKFYDVPVTHWASNVIAFASEKGVIAGNPDGSFAPDGTLTNFQFAKMLLIAMGINDDYSSYWPTSVYVAARKAGLMDGLNLTKEVVLTREQAAQMAMNAITVTRNTTKFDKDSGTYVSDEKDAPALIEDNLGLKKTPTTDETDDFGRPIAYQYKDGDDVVYEVVETPVKVYTDKSSTVEKDLKGYTYETSLVATENGTEGSTSADEATKIEGLTGHGKTVEVYAKDGKITDVVVIKPELAKVTAAPTADVVTLGHGCGSANYDQPIEVESKADGKNHAFYNALSSYSVNSYVIVVLNSENEILSVEPANMVQGKLTQKSTSFVYTVDGKKYEESAVKMKNYTTNPELSATVDVIFLTDANNYIMDFISAVKATDNSIKAIYLTATYKPVTEYGESTDTMFQGVLSDGTVVTGKVDADSVATVANPGAYTYEIADGAYKFTGADANIPTTITKGGVYKVTKETDRASLEINSGDKQMQVIKTGAKNFFSSDVKFVYISGSKAGLTVDVKTGVQGVALKYEKDKSGEDFVVLTEDSNGNKLVTTVYVIDDDNTVDPVKGDKILYVVKKDKIGTALGDDGKEINVFEAYVDGEKIEFNCSDSDLTSKLGWNSYTINSTTGGYSLTKLEIGVAAEENYKDKIVFVNSIYYVTLGTDLYDATNAKVVDLRGTKTTPPDEIKTMADLLKANKDNDNLKIAVSYDKDAKTIDLIYVTADAE